ncbi:MAG TPA: DUF3500 domain-containing protein [Burkholderiaceae bacterium]|nr:DUF3500 domain-containing protein [Burkholderiaceae bacterium]
MSETPRTLPCPRGWQRLAAVTSLLALAAPTQAQEPPRASVAATGLMSATPPGARAALLQPFTLDARSDWHYTPRRRAGIAWREMSAAQRAATTELLRSALSENGLDKVRAVMALEIALRELETFGPQRDPENYAIAIFGEPDGGSRGWGWRIEGHHLSLHWTLQGDRYVATLPQFFGANPARVPRDFGASVRAGTRVLGSEEDLARALLGSLSPQQRASALIDSRPYGDIVTRNAARAQLPAAKGVAFPELSAGQQAQLLSLVSVFAEHLRPELAQARLARVRANDGLQTLRFGWAGAVEPGQPFYFRVQGAAFVIEFDNSGGNHVHSVWRDGDGDWGRDVLAEHYRDAPAQHGHGTR